MHSLEHGSRSEEKWQHRAASVEKSDLTHWVYLDLIQLHGVLSPRPRSSRGFSEEGEHCSLAHRCPELQLSPSRGNPLTVRAKN